MRKKYEMCKNWREKGQCRYGDKCLFAHGEHELTRRTPAVIEEPKANTPVAKIEIDLSSTPSKETLKGNYSPVIEDDTKLLIS